MRIDSIRKLSHYIGDPVCLIRYRQVEGMDVIHFQDYFRVDEIKTHPYLDYNEKMNQVTLARRLKYKKTNEYGYFIFSHPLLEGKEVVGIDPHIDIVTVVTQFQLSQISPKEAIIQVLDDWHPQIIEEIKHYVNTGETSGEGK